MGRKILDLELEIRQQKEELFRLKESNLASRTATPEKYNGHKKDWNDLHMKIR